MKGRTDKRRTPVLNGIARLWETLIDEKLEGAFVRDGKPVEPWTPMTRQEPQPGDPPGRVRYRCTVHLDKALYPAATGFRIRSATDGTVDHEHRYETPLAMPEGDFYKYQYAVDLPLLVVCSCHTTVAE